MLSDDNGCTCAFIQSADADPKDPVRKCIACRSRESSTDKCHNCGKGLMLSNPTERDSGKCSNCFYNSY